MATWCSWGPHAVVGTETMESEAWCHVWIQERLGWAEHRVIFWSFALCCSLVCKWESSWTLSEWIHVHFLNVGVCTSSDTFPKGYFVHLPCFWIWGWNLYTGIAFPPSCSLVRGQLQAQKWSSVQCDYFLHTLKTCIRLCFPVQEWEYYKITPSVDLLSCNKAGWCLIALLPFFLFLLQLFLLLIVNSNA